VVRLAATGATNADVARALTLSVGTVKTHLNQAYRKLGVRSRTQLVNTVSNFR
jgi:DNA-binding NarL/FixJ family response regulator